MLAFSGGLDTSYCVPALAEAGWMVHTAYINTGAPPPRSVRRFGVRPSESARHHEIDARDVAFDRFVRYLIQGNVLRGKRHAA